MALEMDDSTWPLVIGRVVGTSTDAELQGILARLDGYLERGERFALLIDSRGGGGFSPEQRTLVLTHMKANAERTARLMVQAVVIDNLIQRTLFFGLNLLFPNPFPSKAFSDLEQAREWVLAELARGPVGP